jgi:hypothetical protein
MWVKSKSTNALTVQRGVWGTTAVAGTGTIAESSTVGAQAGDSVTKLTLTAHATTNLQTYASTTLDGAITATATRIKVTADSASTTASLARLPRTTTCWSALRSCRLRRLTATLSLLPVALSVLPLLQPLTTLPLRGELLLRLLIRTHPPLSLLVLSVRLRRPLSTSPPETHLPSATTS